MKKYLILAITTISIGLLSLTFQQPKQAVENTLQYNFAVQPLALNTDAAQFAPAFYQNGIVYSSAKTDAFQNGILPVGNNANLYYTQLLEGNAFKKPVKLKGKDEAGFETAGACFTPSGNQIIYTRNKDKSEKNESATWGLYFASINGTAWGESEPFVHNFKQYDVMQASLSADGNMLFFVADLQGGVGGTDIYLCYKVGNSWTRPENLGSRVNSIYNESYPFMAADGTLYFASSGFDSGIDGLDIFYTRKTAGEWDIPQKLPTPANSAKDDFGFIIKTDDNGNGIGYLTSNRNGKTGLFSFTVTITRTETAMFAHADMPVSREVSLPDATSATMSGKEALLNGIIGMNKLFFPTGKWHLVAETSRELDKLAFYMEQNPKLSVSIGVHTDSRGDDEANLQLSAKRANAIQTYLLGKNIAANRITAMGYGETQLLNYCRNGMNCNDEMHDQNNRVEVKATAESVFTVNWGNANYNNVAFADNATNEEPIARTIDRQSGDVNGKLLYKLTVGPFERIDNRVFYECRQIDNTPTYEDSPKGKFVVLGPFDNMQEAYRSKAYLETRGIHRAQVNSVSTSALERYQPPKNNLFEDKDSDAAYQIYIGPFKHVDNNTYHRFANLGTPLHVEYTPKGMMIVLGPYKTMNEVEQYKDLVKERIATNKTKVVVYNENEQMPEQPTNWWAKLWQKK